MISFKITGLNPEVPPTLVSSEDNSTQAYFLTNNAKIVRVNLINEDTLIAAPIVDQIWNLSHKPTCLAIAKPLSSLEAASDFVVAYFGNVNGQVYSARLGAQGDLTIMKELVSFEKPVKLLRLSKNQEYLVCASEGTSERVRVVKLKTGQRHFLPPAFDHNVDDIQIDREDKRMGVALSNRDLYLYDFPPAYRDVQEEEELEAEDEQLLELLREEEDDGLPDPNQAKALLKIVDFSQGMKKPVSLSWGENGLYVGGSSAIVKVTKAEHYQQEPMEGIKIKEGAFERVVCFEGTVGVQNGKAITLWSQEEIKKIKEFEFKGSSAWSASAELAVGVREGNEVWVMDLLRKESEECERGEEKNPFLLPAKEEEEKKEESETELLEMHLKNEKAEKLRAREKRSFNNSADLIRADIIEKEEILCSKKEGLLIRSVALQEDIVELHFREEARKALNTKLINEHGCEMGCFSLKGIILVKNGEGEHVLLFRKLREGSLFVSNWEAQLPHRVESLAMTQKYNMCATENGEVHLFSLNGLKLGSIKLDKLIFTIAASEQTLAVLHSSAETEREIERSEGLAYKEKNLRETVHLKLYSYDSFGEIGHKAQAITVPTSENCAVKWVGFMEKMEIGEEEQNGEGMGSGGQEQELPLILFQNGALLVFTRTEVWLKIKHFASCGERVLSVELDSILSYDVRFPFEQSEHSFSEASAEEGGMGGILMLKNCMGLLSGRLSEEQIRRNETLSLLNGEYEKKVMKGVKVAISEKNMALALDYAQLMLTREGLTVAARMAQKLRQEELAERIEALALEKKEQRPPQSGGGRTENNPLKILLEDYEGLDLNNIRLKYGSRAEDSLQEEGRAYTEGEGEGKKVEQEYEVGGVGADPAGYSGSSFSFQLSKDTEEILQMQKTEETKREHTLTSEEQVGPGGMKREMNLGGARGKIFGKAKQGATQGKKASFMDALKANPLMPKKRAKKQ